MWYAYTKLSIKFPGYTKYKEVQIEHVLIPYFCGCIMGQSFLNFRLEHLDTILIKQETCKELIDVLSLHYLQSCNNFEPHGSKAIKWKHIDGSAMYRKSQLPFRSPNVVLINGNNLIIYSHLI